MKAKDRTARVLNLLRRVNLDGASMKKRSVHKLLTLQPEARRIQFHGRCDACKQRGTVMLSYQMPFDTPGKRMGRKEPDGWEDCGWYCARCNFSNGGAREVRRRTPINKEKA